MILILVRQQEFLYQRDERIHHCILANLAHGCPYPLQEALSMR
jgi:hypothetical protein